jgi:hypothetical protein
MSKIIKTGIFLVILILLPWTSENQNDLYLKPHVGLRMADNTDEVIYLESAAIHFRQKPVLCLINE